MRTATLIVGAIAVTSILIALAFILSPGGGTSPGKTTTVIHRIVEAPEPASEETGAVEDRGGTRSGVLKPCGGGEYAVEGTSCAIGAQVHEDYEGGDRGDLLAEGEAGATLTFSCKDDTVPITCTGEEGGVVYFGG
jgi:hypothetical protein